MISNDCESTRNIDLRVTKNVRSKKLTDTESVNNEDQICVFVCVGGHIYGLVYCSHMFLYLENTTG